MTSLVTNLDGTEKPKFIKMGNSFNHKDIIQDGTKNVLI